LGFRVTAASRRQLLPLSLGAVAAVFHLLTATDGFGLFRDELYYIACSERLGLGYVDHPPLVAWLTRFGRIVFGESMLGLRVLPALAAGGTVFCTAKTARAMGGNRLAQALAATAAIVAPVYVSIFGRVSMNPYDILIWSASAWVLASIFRDGNGRGWIVFGVLAGVGLQNKLSVLFLGFGLVVGLVLTFDRRAFTDRRLWVGGLIAAALFLPQLIWQIAHGWPTLEFMANATRNKNLPLAPVDFLSEQILMMNPAALPMFVAGLGFLLFTRRGRPYRALGWAFVAITILMITERTKAYYLSPAYTMIFAAGAVAVTALTTRRGLRWVGPGYIALLVVVGAIVAPLAKPLLSIERHVAYTRALGVAPSTSERKEVGRLSQDFADRLGWPELAETVAGVYDMLSADERDRACVFGQNYGQAGAIDHYGSRHGLPTAISGHNSYWIWGPGECSGEVMIVIGDEREDLESLFEHVELGATYACSDCMPYEGNKPIWIARGMREPLDRIWPRIKHFD
jgi:hypothetical protein